MAYTRATYVQILSDDYVAWHNGWRWGNDALRRPGIHTFCIFKVIREQHSTSRRDTTTTKIPNESIRLPYAARRPGVILGVFYRHNTTQRTHSHPHNGNICKCTRSQPPPAPRHPPYNFRRGCIYKFLKFCMILKSVNHCWWANCMKIGIRPLGISVCQTIFVGPITKTSSVDFRLILGLWIARSLCVADTNVSPQIYE